MFYFVNNDELMFKNADDLIKDDEIRFRQNLRKDFERHLGFTTKLRQYDMLLKLAKKNPDDENNKFIEEKMDRYKLFVNNIITFTLSMISDMLWEDFSKMK